MVALLSLPAGAVVGTVCFFAGMELLHGALLEDDVRVFLISSVVGVLTVLGWLAVTVGLVAVLVVAFRPSPRPGSCVGHRHRVSPALSAGTAIMGDFSTAISVVTHEAGTRLSMDPFTDFATNQTNFRAEFRAAVAFTAPYALRVVELV